MNLFVKVRKEKELKNYFISLVMLVFVLFLAFLRYSKGYSIIVSESSFKLLDSFNIFIPNYVIFFSISVIFIFIFIIFYNLSKFNKHYSYFLMTLVLSPIILFSILNVSIKVIELGILFLAILLIYKKKSVYSYILFGILSLMELEFLFFSLFFILALYFKDKVGSFKKLFFIFSPILLVRLILYFYNDVVISKSFNFVSIIQEFGNYFGISMIVVSLAFISLIIFWKGDSIFEFILTFLVIIFIYLQNLFILNIIVMYFFSLLIYNFSSLNWSIKLFKIFSYLILILVLFNSIVIFSTEYVGEDPTSDDLDLFDAVSDLDSGVVLYDSSKSYALEYFSSQDSFSKYDDKFSLSIMLQIFYSTDLDHTLDLLEQNNISYLALDSNMVQKYWKGQENGLLVLLMNEDHFQLVNSSSDYNIYKVIY